MIQWKVKENSEFLEKKNGDKSQNLVKPKFEILLSLTSSH